MLGRAFAYLRSEHTMRKSRKFVSTGVNTDMKSARIDIRSPGGSIIVGDHCLIQGTLVTEIATSAICIGNNVSIGGDTIIDCVVSVEIEDDVFVSYQCLLADSD